MKNVWATFETMVLGNMHKISDKTTHECRHTLISN